MNSQKISCARVVHLLVFFSGGSPALRPWMCGSSLACMMFCSLQRCAQLGTYTRRTTRVTHDTYGMNRLHGEDLHCVPFLAASQISGDLRISGTWCRVWDASRWARHVLRPHPCTNQWVLRCSFSTQCPPTCSSRPLNWFVPPFLHIFLWSISVLLPFLDCFASFDWRCVTHSTRRSVCSVCCEMTGNGGSASAQWNALHDALSVNLASIGILSSCPGPGSR